MPNRARPRGANLLEDLAGVAAEHGEALTKLGRVLARGALPATVLEWVTDTLPDGRVRLGVRNRRTGGVAWLTDPF